MVEPGFKLTSPHSQAQPSSNSVRIRGIVSLIFVFPVSNIVLTYEMLSEQYNRRKRIMKHEYLLTKKLTESP